MNTFFSWCCSIVSFIANALNITYAECNILIFLHILPTIYLLSSVVMLISGFFKRSWIFKSVCIIVACWLGVYEFEYLFTNLTTYTLTQESFDKYVLILQEQANILGCSYQVINILEFCVFPILYLGLKGLCIFAGNKHG